MTASPSISAARIPSLYRSLLREVNKLPYGYLRAFFRFKFRDDVVSAARSISHAGELSNAKLNRLEREIRKLRAANEGNRKAFARLLDLAYGRVGKLRRELIEPFLHSSTVEAPPIIPGVEKSRPPVYTQEMTALLTSPISRTVRRALRIEHLKTPPSLPPRVDPTSEEARLLGPLSKRREVNARWRFFTKESRKLYPPMQVSVMKVDRGTGIVTALPESDRAQAMRELGLINGGLQGSGLLESLEHTTSNIKQPPTRRERMALESHPEGVRDHSADNLAIVTLPTRLLRRSHQVLLGKVPRLTYYQRVSTAEGNSRKSGSYQVSLARQASSPNLRYTATRLVSIDEKNMAWIRRAKDIDEKQKSTTKDDKLRSN